MISLGERLYFSHYTEEATGTQDSNVPVYTMDSKFKLKISPFKVEWPFFLTVLQKPLNIMVSTMLATQKMKTSSVDPGGLRNIGYWVIG